MPPQSKSIVLAIVAVAIATCAFEVGSALQNKTESPTVVAVDGGEIFRNH